jgi:hypothetical protein
MEFSFPPVVKYPNCPPVEKVAGLAKVNRNPPWMGRAIVLAQILEETPQIHQGDLLYVFIFEILDEYF